MPYSGCCDLTRIETNKILNLSKFPEDHSAIPARPLPRTIQVICSAGFHEMYNYEYLNLENLP